MSQICLTLPSCWPLQVPLVCQSVPDVPCLGVDDLAVSEIKPGGRTLIVTPYTKKICSGQYGQWQVLTGMGGQISRGIFMGKSVSKNKADYGSPGIVTEVDMSDCCQPGEKCVAIRDRGRWYMTKLGGGASTTPVIQVINGSDAQKMYGLDVIKVRATAFPVMNNITKDASNYLDGKTPFVDGFGVGRIVGANTPVFIANGLIDAYGGIGHLSRGMLYAGDMFVSTSTIELQGGKVPGSAHYAILAYVPEILL